MMGVDPGTVVMGWGVIDSEEGNLRLVDYGALKCRPRLATDQRIKILYQGLYAIMEKYRPDAVAIEQPFVSENIQSALAIGKAQAVAILAAVNHNLPTGEYSPAKIKQQIANYGTSGKAQIQEMVRLLLHLDVAPEPADAADALAVALCHLQEIHLRDIIAGKSGGG
jgi:crossover junction endodeoxyribonuclease RuvC